MSFIGNSDMKEINIEKIMEEIRAEIKDKYGDAAVNFETVKQEGSTGTALDLSAFREELHYANLNYEMNYYFPLPGGVKGFVKKVIRKLGAFLGFSLTQKQTEYNAKTVRMFNQLNNYIEYQEAKNKELERIIEALEERVVKLEQCEAKR